MKRLKNFSDKELMNRLRVLVKKEQDLTLEILPFLAEVDRRELYLPLGFSSLTDYCISFLGYGESSAWRRVRAARVVKIFPEVYDLLRSGHLTFSAVVLASKVLKQNNKSELLPRLRGKSQNEIKRIVVEYEQPRIVPDRTRPRLVAKKVAVPPAWQLSDEKMPEDVGEIPLRSEGKKLANGENSTPENHQVMTVLEKMYEIRFAADEELMKLIRWMRSYLSGRYPKGAGFLDIFKFAISYVREREDLAIKAERRKKTNYKKKISNVSSKRLANTNSRYIPQRVREKVWIKDDGRCSFVGTNGKRCGSTHNLQFDHYPIPFARGGTSTADNLRLLCAKHNRYTAEQAYGKKHMEFFRSKRE